MTELGITVSELTLGQLLGAFTIVLAVGFFGKKVWEKCHELFMIAFKKTSKKMKTAKMLERHDEDITVIKQDLKKNNDAMVAILRSNLINECRKLEGATFISALDYENLDGMFKNYENLGGNHLITRLYTWFEKLNVVIDETEAEGKDNVILSLNNM